MSVIGYTRNGFPIYGIAGGSDDESSSESDKDTEGDEGEGAGDGTDETDWKAEAEKHKALMRKWESRAKSNADAAKKLKEIEDANKSEQQKAADKATQAEQRAVAAEAKALRYEVAAEKGIPAKLMRFLTGSTQEELEESADALLEAMKGDKDESDKDKKPSGTPKEKLKSGAKPDTEPDETDPRKLAETVRKY